MLYLCTVNPVNFGASIRYFFDPRSSSFTCTLSLRIVAFFATKGRRKVSEFTRCNVVKFGQKFTLLVAQFACANRGQCVRQDDDWKHNTRTRIVKARGLCKFPIVILQSSSCQSSSSTRHPAGQSGSRKRRTSYPSHVLKYSATFHDPVARNYAIDEERLR